MRICDCPENQLLFPTKETVGYRWVVGGIHVYIVTIKVNGPYCKNIQGKNEKEKTLEYLTEDWTILEIRDAIENKTTDKIDGQARAYFESNIEYYVGNHITGEPVYFCISIDDFQKSQLGPLKYLCKRAQMAQSRIRVKMLSSMFE